MNVWNMSHRPFIIARRLECGAHDVTHFCNRNEMGHSLFSTIWARIACAINEMLHEFRHALALFSQFRLAIHKSVRISTCLGTVSRRKSVPTLSAAKRKCENNHRTLSASEWASTWQLMASLLESFGWEMKSNWVHDLSQASIEHQAHLVCLYAENWPIQTLNHPFALTTNILPSINRNILDESATLTIWRCVAADV